jgi:hypothetical protein
MVYGLWFMVYGLWFMVYGLWFMVYGLWFMVYGLWFMVYGLGLLAFFVRAVRCCCARSTARPIRVACEASSLCRSMARSQPPASRAVAAQAECANPKFEKPGNHLMIAPQWLNRTGGCQAVGGQLHATCTEPRRGFRNTRLCSPVSTSTSISANCSARFAKKMRAPAYTCT